MAMQIRVHQSAVFLRYREGMVKLPALWCLHGFGASGASFLEAFDSPDLRSYSLFVPDFPGFGASPEGAEPQGIHEASELLLELLAAYSGEQEIALLAHSAGGLIATQVARELPRAKHLISVEGNLTEADTFLSGKAAGAADIEAWRTQILQTLSELAETSEAIRRYCCDLKRAAPRTLMAWGSSTVRETGVTLGGERYRDVECSKLYIFGGRSVPPPTRRFLCEHRLANLEFAQAGHSPMIDEPEPFYAAVARFLEGGS